MSFLFFGRQQNTYQFMLLGGILFSFVSYLTILFSTETVKSKLIWTLVILLSIVFQWLTEPLLIKTSYLIFLKGNNVELSQVNFILENKTSGITITSDTIYDKNKSLTQSEKRNLHKLRQKLGVYFISKSEKEIYYGLWGFLDVRIGLVYMFKKSQIDSSRKPIIDKWYILQNNN
jgi:hypothetical protein